MTQRVGMVGAGQLARMTYQAGIDLGLTVRILAERADDSAARVGADVTIGSPNVLEDLDGFARSCDIVTFDHELVSPALLQQLVDGGAVLRPAPASLLLAQDKWLQRQRFRDMGLPLPPFVLVNSNEDVRAFAATHGWPIVIKAARGGYDGHGVWVVRDESTATSVLAAAYEQRLMLFAEPFLPIDREIAVIVARRPSGQTVTYPTVETVQMDGMCREVIAPASIEAGLARSAQQLALQIAESIEVAGILAVEFFVADGQLLVNELAMRPHNSGHYSLSGCRTSQFENHLRAVLDWPLGEPTLLAPAVVTVNVVGAANGADPQQFVPLALAVPGVSVHVYGKNARPGRKLGHVTALGADSEETRRRAQRAADLLATGSSNICLSSRG